MTREAFSHFYVEIGALLRELFVGVEEVVEWNIPGYGIPISNPPKKRGTMPHDKLMVLPTEKKAGITIHIWHPNVPNHIADNAAWLREAGFKPMVGCLQWNRKSELPLDALRKLLAALPDAQ